jgi:NTE family protein
MARQIALALQGGGAHGAFTWGVLEGLLAELAKGTIELAGLSGTSAGALNATALAYGMREGAALPGPASARNKRLAEAARAKIEHLWGTLAQAAFWGGNPFVATIGLSPSWNIDESPAARFADVAAASLVPPDIGIGNYLSGVMRTVFPDLPAILARPEKGIPTVMVAATDIEECRRQLFVDGAVSPDALKASASAPTVQTVRIDGRHYWDGGFMGNPPLAPLVDHMRRVGCDDLLLVTLSPLHRDGVPRGPRQVMDRLGEITQSASLVHEVHAIETLNQLIDSGHVKAEAGLRRINLHRVEADTDLKALGITSKDAPAWDFLVHLRDLGRQTFESMWPGIEASLGTRSSWDTKAICDQVLAR